MVKILYAVREYKNGANSSRSDVAPYIETHARMTQRMQELQSQGWALHDIDLGGIYTMRRGRDLLVLNISAEGLDEDFGDLEN